MPGVDVPTYICRAPAALFGPTSKAALAKCITDIHAEVTGGGRKFTQVIFRGSNQDDCYIAGKVLEGPHCIIQGHIRAGRSAVERAALIRAMLPAISEILGVPRYAVWIYLSELPSRAMACDTALCTNAWQSASLMPARQCLSQKP